MVPGGGSAGAGAAAGGDAGVLTLEPVLLASGVSGAPLTLTAQLERPAGLDVASLAATLHWQNGLGESGSIPALTDAFGVAVFLTTVQPGVTEYWATVGELDSNRVEIVALDPRP